MARLRTSFTLLALLAAAAAPAVAAPTAATTPAPESATAAATARLPGTVLDQVVAAVNDEPILESSLDEEMTRVQQSLQAQGTPLPPAAVLRHQVLEHLITQNLELQAAKNSGIQISDDEVNRALSRIAENNGLTLAQLPQTLAAQGGSYAAFRRMVHDELVVHQLEQQAVAAKVQVSPAEIDSYLKNRANNVSSNVQYHLAQILIPFPSNPTPAQVKKTLAKAQAVETKLKSGANFAATAVADSAGPHALQGGDIGWLTASQLPTLFVGVVTQMKAGDISAPIAGAGGYHIVRLIAARRQDSKALATEYHVEHILLRPNPVRSLAQCEALAKRLRSEIASGKLSFSDAAKQYSDDPNSAGNGGDMGWVGLDELPPDFAQTVKGLPIGQLSQPVQSQYGWHLIKVTGTRKRDQTQEQRRSEAYQVIFQRKLTDQLAEFRRSLRDQSYIKIFASANAASDDGEATGGR